MCVASHLALVTQDYFGVLDLVMFCINFSIVFFISVTNAISILLEIVLNLYVSLGSAAIVTILFYPYRNRRYLFII